MEASVALRPVDGVHVTTLIDNYTDVLLPDEGPIKRWGAIGTGGRAAPVPDSISVSGQTGDGLRAEHGFSALVELRVAGGVRRILFDAGVTPDGLIGNLDRLQLRPDSFEAIVFSHGHFDHVMGLDGLVRRLGTSNMPVYLHPDFWRQRRLVSGPDRAFELPVPSRSAIEGVGFSIIEGRQPSYLLDGMLLVTGEVDRTVPFEQGLPNHEAYVSGAWQPDPLIHDDQALVLHVAGKGLVILTGCGHAGVVNIVRYARRLTGVDQVYAVLGGFHLRAGPVVAETVAALADLSPGLLVPSHCTSWTAQQALAAAMPSATRPNTVGTRFEL
ncbi:7,8-dihydropterin-6-yl-methyl-4-(beta-D-ribofuranosyl)aminobenzene 5'-phosphate synthase [Asanoa hainanensis]|uniref:7,8-dihydropterin-6-yl-methyl-4-(Beta-D-ribofuranosyl)aminobenzene 5'-phosphate synthase n=1 Tax=Asanoa hainanensis TaxID=560556 RepID=A0A239P7F4_9ACTN|nr:MBL fold metallo-hydrolase [Asanoa hainanensis]SNT62971.1 7,8-dihydropterin-6-yl-methyl-4-(beta-D-ribofuranosyl)aminobenzene 5'-phosphate synthase [Asanoa hainanensis]